MRYGLAMGTWDTGPFDNDGAADFLDDAAAMPAPSIAEALLAVADAGPAAYLDVDVGQGAIAACELVALGFGYGNLHEASDAVRDLARTLGPNEDLRVLALRVIPRLRDREHSEIAELWEADPSFDAFLGELLERLTEAGLD